MIGEEVYFNYSLEVMKEVDYRLKQYLREYSSEVGHKVQLDSKLTELGLDSLQSMELLVYVEEKFGIAFKDLEALEVRTWQDLKALTYKYYAEKRNTNLLAVRNESGVVIKDNY